MRLKAKVMVGLLVVAILIASGTGMLFVQGRSVFTYSYVVQNGDTINSLANRFNVKWTHIASLNNIAYPYTLLVGASILIPCHSSLIDYTVHKRDTLQKIASKFEVNELAIAATNGLSSPYPIYQGELLIIPLDYAVSSTTSLSTTSTLSSTDSTTTIESSTSASTSVTINSTSITESTTTSLSSANTYTVVAGDSLYGIGLMFNVPWQSIAQANNISSPYTIYPGEVLVIPDISTITTSSYSNTTSLSTTENTNSDQIATGNSLYDHYDSIILTAAKEYGLDPMILKSQIAQESYFNPLAVSPDDPCGPLYQDGVDVGHSYGLLQMTPACNPDFAHNPDGTIDLTTNSSSPQWAYSAFNPAYNIYSAAQGLSHNLNYAQQQYAGCTSNQYVYMSLSMYNAGPGSVSSCSVYNQMGAIYVQNILNWYSQLSAMANLTDPYQ